MLLPPRSRVAVIGAKRGFVLRRSDALPVPLTVRSALGGDFARPGLTASSATTSTLSVRKRRCVSSGEAISAEDEGSRSRSDSGGLCNAETRDVCLANRAFAIDGGRSMGTREAVGVGAVA